MRWLNRQFDLKKLKMDKEEIFILKKGHLDLARAMHVRWQGGDIGAPEIDFKRPYGNGFIPADVAEILGLQWPNDDESDQFEMAMMAIHREMVTVLQILLGSAGEAIVPGVYRNIADGHYRPRWKLDSSENG